jgi:hypothetical protein
MAIILSSPDSAPLNTVMICWNTVATTVNVSFKDGLFALWVPTDWLGTFLYIIFMNSVLTSQETHYVSATKTNRLMPFRETAAVYCESDMKNINTVMGKMQGLVKLRQVVPLCF